jgi:hypothetical protein
VTFLIERGVIVRFPAAAQRHAEIALQRVGAHGTQLVGIGLATAGVLGGLLVGVERPVQRAEWRAATELSDPLRQVEVGGAVGFGARGGCVVAQQVIDAAGEFPFQARGDAVGRRFGAVGIDGGAARRLGRKGGNALLRDGAVEVDVQPVVDGFQRA